MSTFTDLFFGFGFLILKITQFIVWAQSVLGLPMLWNGHSNFYTNSIKNDILAVLSAYGGHVTRLGSMVGKWVYLCKSSSTMAECEGWRFETRRGDEKDSISFSDA